MNHHAATGQLLDKVYWGGLVRVAPGMEDAIRERVQGWDVLSGKLSVDTLRNPEVRKFLRGWKDHKLLRHAIRPTPHGTDRHVLAPGELFLLPKPNLVVNTGVQRSLDKMFGISGTPSIPAGNVVRMGVDNGTTAPASGSRSSDQGNGTTDTGSSSQTLAAFDATPTRSNNIVTSVRTFNDVTTGGIGAVGFAMKRLFLSAHTANITNTTSADAQDTLVSMTGVFTIDFTGISTWTIVFSATYTGAGT